MSEQEQKDWAAMTISDLQDSEKRYYERARKAEAQLARCREALQYVLDEGERTAVPGWWQRIQTYVRNALEGQ